MITYPLRYKSTAEQAERMALRGLQQQQRKPNMTTQINPKLMIDGIDIEEGFIDGWGTVVSQMTDYIKSNMR